MNEPSALRFGTCVANRADLSIRYGLTEPILSYNRVRAALHGWQQPLHAHDALRSRYR